MLDKLQKIYDDFDDEIAAFVKNDPKFAKQTWWAMMGINVVTLPVQVVAQFNPLCWPVLFGWHMTAITLSMNLDRKGQPLIISNPVL